MNIYDFEKRFDAAILSRAKNYYDEGHVKYLEYLGGDIWTATVEGTNDYTVVVRLDGNEIAHSECDCPYDGGLCKHEGAVFLTIREKMETEEADEMEKRNLDVLLAGMDREELRSVLFDILCRNRRFRDEIWLRYEDENNTTGRVRNLTRIYMCKTKHYRYRLF